MNPAISDFQLEKAIHKSTANYFLINRLVNANEGGKIEQKNRAELSWTLKKLNISSNWLFLIINCT